MRSPHNNGAVEIRSVGFTGPAESVQKPFRASPEDGAAIAVYRWEEAVGALGSGTFVTNDRVAVRRNGAGIGASSLLQGAKVNHACAGLPAESVKLRSELL